MSCWVRRGINPRPGFVEKFTTSLAETFHVITRSIPRKSTDEHSMILLISIVSLDMRRCIWDKKRNSRRVLLLATKFFRLTHVYRKRQRNRIVMDPERQRECFYWNVFFLLVGGGSIAWGYGKWIRLGIDWLLLANLILMHGCKIIWGNKIHINYYPTLKKNCWRYTNDTVYILYFFIYFLNLKPEHLNIKCIKILL